MPEVKFVSLFGGVVCSRAPDVKKTVEHFTERTEIAGAHGGAVPARAGGVEFAGRVRENGEQR
jgi:hypothetical protein